MTRFNLGSFRQKADKNILTDVLRLLFIAKVKVRYPEHIICIQRVEALQLLRAVEVIVPLIQMLHFLAAYSTCERCHFFHAKTKKENFLRFYLHALRMRVPIITERPCFRQALRN